MNIIIGYMKHGIGYSNITHITSGYRVVCQIVYNVHLHIVGQVLIASIY